MTFTYWLPDEQGQKQEYTTSNNSVIIIGANGSGKSHLGAWIEQQDLENVHRIGAQRNLNFNEDICNAAQVAAAEHLLCVDELRGLPHYIGENRGRFE